MSIGWTIPDAQKRIEPWKYETFRGYFTDIRRAARKSLPSQPDKDLCNLLCLSTRPAELAATRVKVPRHVDPVIVSPPKDLVPVSKSTRRPRNTPKVDRRQTRRWTDIKDALLCRKGNENDQCTQREKAIFGFSVYFAFVTIILLIIIIILVSTLSSNNTTNNSSANHGSITGPELPDLGSTSNPNDGKTNVHRTTADKSTNNPITMSATSELANTKSISNMTTSKNAPDIESTVSHSFFANISWPNSNLTTEAFTETKTTATTFHTLTEVKNRLSTQNSQRSNFTKSPITQFSKSSTFKPPLANTTSSPLITNSSYVSTTMSLTVNTTIQPSNVTAVPIEKQMVSPSCWNHLCNASRETLSKVDFSTSPCDDFVHHACGKWEDNVRSSIDVSSNSPSSSVREEIQHNMLPYIKEIVELPHLEKDSFAVMLVKSVYKRCMQANTEGTGIPQHDAMQDVRTIIAVIDLHENASLDISVPELLRVVLNRFRVTPFFQLSYQPLFNSKDQQEFGLKIEPPVADADLELHVVNGTLVTSDTYIHGVTTIITKFLRSVNTGQQDDITSKIAAKMASAFVYIKLQLVKVLNNRDITVKRQHDIKLETTTVMALDLNTMFPFFNWSYALDMEDGEVLVELIDSGYFAELESLLADVDRDEVKWYIFISALLEMWKFVPYEDKLDIPSVKLNKQLTSVDCVNVAHELAKEEMHAAFISQFTKKVLDDRLIITVVHQSVSQAFQQLLSESTSVPPTLVLVASALAKQLRLYFSPLKSNIQDTPILRNNLVSFLVFVANLKQQNHNVEHRKLGSRLNQIEMDWSDYRMHYDPQFHTLGIPTGVTVFLEKHNPDFLTYGRLGMLMAEEFIKILTGDLDDGAPPTWWGSSNILAFQDTLGCFQNQSTKIMVYFNETSQNVLIDGALQVAHKAYVTQSTAKDSAVPGTSLTEETLFFLNAIQIHCKFHGDSHLNTLNRERLKNIAKNRVPFQLFNCKRNSKMIVTDKCSLL